MHTKNLKIMAKQIEKECVTSKVIDGIREKRKTKRMKDKWKNKDSAK